MVGSFEAEAGRRTVSAPPFSVDLALIVTEGDLPDTDADGVANHLDKDDDNDEVPDVQDAWPLEREEWADVDRDRIGDNLDADIDADGSADGPLGTAVKRQQGIAIISGHAPKAWFPY